jgi:hypothetical protein
VLQGTFDTFSFGEVLQLLARARKTGALRVDAGGTATLWLDAGECCAVEGGEHVGAVHDGRELLARLVDVGFGVARLGAGGFRFIADETAPWTAGTTVTVERLLADIEPLLAQWREIEAVVPSLECRPVLNDELGRERLEVDRDVWRLLVSVDGRRTVRDLAHRTGASVFDLCHTLMDLVAAGAVAVPAAPDVLVYPHPIPEGVVQPEAPYGPGVDVPHRWRAQGTGAVPQPL